MVNYYQIVHGHINHLALKIFQLIFVLNFYKKVPIHLVYYGQKVNLISSFFQYCFQKQFLNTFSKKATGEPALCMSYNIIIALRYALDSARKDAGGLEYWFNLGKFLGYKKLTSFC